MVFVAICQYFFLRKKTFITELLQTTFHIIKNFSLGIKYFCGFCYKTFEIRIHPAKFVDCIIIQFILPCRK